MALSADRNTPQKEGSLRNLPVAATTKIFQGALVCRNAAGNAVPGSVSTTLKPIGVAQEFVDNSAGSAGDKRVTVKRGVFRFKNSASGDAITDADVGNDCYIVDDETLAKTSATNTRSIAGKVYEVDAQGVWLEIA